MSNAIDFVTLDPDAFEYGGVVEVGPNIRRVIAKNPSKFTYHGTGTYIVGHGDVAVIDPGPNLDSHRDALATALSGERVRSILVTHCHSDHSPLAAWLKAECDAPTVAFGPHDRPGAPSWDIGSDPEGFGEVPETEKTAGDGNSDDGTAADADNDDEPKVEESTDRAFAPDITAATGDVVASAEHWTMTALHTPGHTSNHTCFALDDGVTHTLFTGDHVMGWSTTVVSPPDGDMAAYFESLRVVAGRDDHVAIPTHGSPIPSPARYVEQLIAHRVEREQQIIDSVRSGVDNIADIVNALYAHVRVELHKPAARSVLSHLVKLVDEGIVALAGSEARPRLDSSYRPI